MREGLADPFSRSLRAAAFAAAICSRRTDDEDFTVLEAGGLLLGAGAGAGFSFFCIGANASASAGRGFDGLADNVLLSCGLDGDAAPGDGGTDALEG